MIHSWKSSTWLINSSCFSYKPLQSLREKYPNTELFLVRIFLYSDWIRREVSKYGVISDPYFPVFWLNTERYRGSFRIQSDYRKIRTRNNSVFGHLFIHIIISKFYKFQTFVMRCAIWYHLYSFKKVKNTHGGVLLLVKLLAFK